ncbi:MAG: hypothetical protein PHT54_04075 [Candidatus Nanoarchaeia archaeon]|nr:hypothetical protein [Candidatus Nanoarchaeia archaeon]
MIEFISLITVFLVLAVLVITLNVILRIRNYEKKKEFYNLFMFGLFLVIIVILIDSFYLFNLSFGGFGFLDFELIHNIVKVFLVPFIAICFLASVFIIEEE